MNRKALSLFVMGLMLFSVFLVAKPASAQSVQGDKLKIVYLAAQGSLFMGVFNPSPSGMTDVYTNRIWYFLNDPMVVMGPDAQRHDYRCQLVDVKYNVQVPEDAVIWNGTQKQWVSPYAGETAKSAITWKCGLGTWVDGQKITLADYLFDYAMTWEWAYQNGKDDKYYDEQWGNNLQGTLKNIMGLKVDKVTDDYIEYTVYQDYVVPYSKWATALNFGVKPSVPWELYNVMSEMVANGVEDKAFSWSEQPQNGYQIDMIDPDQMKYFKAEAQAILNSGKLIPVWLETVKPVLQKWGITEDQAGLTTDMAKKGYEAVISWIDKYNNAIIGDGPYYVEKYDPKAMTVVLKVADNKRIGYPGEVNGKKLPWDPYWKEIDIYGSLNDDTAILAVAKGEYDLYWYARPYNKLAKALQEYGNNLNPIKTIAVWWALDLNLVGDPQTGLVNSSGTEKFNPFALREVRYAMNWLINRQYIVSQILQGSGAPMFGPEVSGQVDAYARIMTVAKALGFTPQGDEAYAIKMIDDAMNKAAQNLKAKGYTLEKKDGIWYFNGEPVTVKVIARVEDERLDEGKYVAQVLQKAGFKVDLLQWQRSQASKTVYLSDPATLQWSVYTEGWVSSGIQDVASLAWDYWFFDIYVDPNWGTDYHNPITVGDMVKVIAGGDLNKFIQELNLKYYNTPDKLKPLLDWTGYDLASLLAYAKWTGPNNDTIRLQDLNQFWDLYTLAYAVHAYNAPRVYTAETWNFFLTSKKIKVEFVDPISGVGSFIAARSIEPAQTQTTTTSSTQQTTTTSSSQQQTTTTSQPTTSTSQPTSSTSSTSSGGGICGPAFIVGLAVLPLLLRRRK
ncbi:ABC transporter substrate-binding protein [Thermococcus sp. 21S9]|uniref:ABC transporter substrate-binding protein n=1 Tax=Thermococcus sp. 21S9 TaxID=1638223 RepID=UPI00143C2AF5|nr:ABC transporter substrate-binding protein [Thermococcus sp. 21S9]NJE54533.1 CGP-CTERM sorting domain-containing protein [Thermococcus sp. 21S9]